jgi:hypothetical protein
LVSLGRVFGGAVLLHLLGAPAWAVAAWVMAGMRVRVGRRPARRASLDGHGAKEGGQS